jgi:hypothetical protein
MEPHQHAEQAAGDGRAVRRRFPQAGQPRSVARRALEARVQRSVSFDDADLAAGDKLDMCVRPGTRPLPARARGGDGPCFPALRATLLAPYHARVLARPDQLRKSQS